MLEEEAEISIIFFIWAIIKAGMFLLALYRDD